MELTDAAAVALARAGDGDAFRLLVERHSRKIFRLGMRLTGNEGDAEDIVQETFLRAYRSLSQFDERAVFTSWLYRIASNYALDLLRLRHSRPALSLSAARPDSGGLPESMPSGTPGPDRIVFSSQIQQKIAEAMDQLTPHERTAFTLRHFEGHTIEEIGSSLKIGSNAAKQAIFRAVQKMRRALQPVEGATVWRA
jgi:RNA polymerase sigma-70 factor (ECF subfamily)